MEKKKTFKELHKAKLLANGDRKVFTHKDQSLKMDALLNEKTFVQKIGLVCYQIINFNKLRKEQKEYEEKQKHSNRITTYILMQDRC